MSTGRLNSAGSHQFILIKFLGVGVVDFFCSVRVTILTNVTIAAAGCRAFDCHGDPESSFFLLTIVSYTTQTLLIIAGFSDRLNQYLKDKAPVQCQVDQLTGSSWCLQIKFGDFIWF